jgi:hypothetical protein
MCRPLATHRFPPLPPKIRKKEKTAQMGAFPKEKRINHEGAKAQSYHEEIFVPALVPSRLRGKNSHFGQNEFGHIERVFFLERKKQRTFILRRGQHP